jgi:hypothetical protein
LCYNSFKARKGFYLGFVKDKADFSKDPEETSSLQHFDYRKLQLAE